MTAKKREKESFPLRKLLEMKLINGDTLDFGAGYGLDTKKLLSLGYKATSFDPHYFPDYPNRKFDTIICIYVLNVVEHLEQSKIITQITSLLKPEGKAYFAVRRDLKKEGFRKHAKHDAYTYQTNVILNMKSVYRNDFTEIYEFQKFNTLNAGKTDCVFCKTDRETIIENNNAFAIYDKYPVSEGHVLVIPKFHVSDYFELNFVQQLSLWNLVNHIKEYLEEKHSPNGFNIGVNVNEDAGQTVNHVHVHVIPRYTGDMEDPKGGVRGVIPEKQKY